MEKRCFNHLRLIWSESPSILSRSSSWLLLARNMFDSGKLVDNLLVRPLSFTSIRGVRSFYTLYAFCISSWGGSCLFSFLESKALTNSLASIVTYWASSLYLSFIACFPALLFSRSSSSTFFFSVAYSSSNLATFSLSFWVVAIAICTLYLFLIFYIALNFDSACSSMNSSTSSSFYSCNFSNFYR